jgi:hypothetical protein
LIPSDGASGSYSGPEVRFEDIASDLLEPRFWIVSGLPTNRTESPHPPLFHECQRQRSEKKERIRRYGIQWDAGKGDSAGCDCGFLLRTPAEISVMTSPTGKAIT